MPSFFRLGKDTFFTFLPKMHHSLLLIFVFNIVAVKNGIRIKLAKLDIILPKLELVKLHGLM
ncbi:hypothetical protein CDQ84_18310 [Clostridium thermosuccinogenes]|uniref:Uncharacterized protein n=1 Tax=Clostridium thermosuccinogenes TaxID=84032 RepID=A0A2K2EZJ7_9CLOT|nr:hypothetical protein CDO33_12395 [Pseudoclostridium thermosuccinogenes]PNT91937.1 hypothetical protein CDQ85_18270 [Pseudoclostridium thermosuccinogenes]PNT94791.1 hypothetical protein CDQ84_18310 [Pseudoclostridium thermosuccinogenes]